MKQQWQAFAGKFNAMSSRERGMLTIVVALIAVMLVYFPLLEPQLVKHTRLSKQLVEQEQQIAAIRQQILALTAPGRIDPNADKRKRLADIKLEGEQVEQQLAALQQSLVPPAKVANLLEDLLKRNGNLKLMSMTTLPVSPLIKDSAEAGKTPAKPNADNRALLFKHGVSLTVTGSYADMLAYLAALEALPWQMYWSGVFLNVDEYPQASLTLTVFTLSQDKTWLSL